MIRFLVLLLTFITGFSALVYEVTWHKYLANILGSQAQAAALILAIFLGGLSLGYHFFGILSKNRAADFLLRLCGFAEICIAIWGILFSDLYHLVWESIGLTSFPGVKGFILDCSTAIALIGLPTLLMGGTLPLLTQGLARSMSDAPSVHAKIYSVNTAGAFFGALASGFFLIENYGLPGTISIAAAGNFIGGIGILFLAEFIGPERFKAIDEDFYDAELVDSNPLEARTLTLSQASGVAFLNGFYSLALQTIIIRVIALSASSSEYVFSIVVAVFISMLALGSATLTGNSQHKVKKLPLVWKNQLAIAVGLILLYLTVPYVPYIIHVVRSLLTDTLWSFYLFQFLLFLITLTLLLIPVGAMGRCMPLVFSSVTVGFGELGSAVGILYAINTVGCVFGALIGGFLALYWIDLDLLLKITTALAILSMIVALPNASTARPVGGMAALLLFFVVIALPSWNYLNLASGLYRIQHALPETYLGPNALYSAITNNQKLLAHKDDPNTSVSVREEAVLDPEEIKKLGVNYTRSLLVNGKSDGATSGGDLTTTKLLGYLPQLFFPGRDAAVSIVGFGTGITAGTFLNRFAISTIKSIEIAPFVKNFAGFFDFANGFITKHAEHSFEIGDAYRVLGGNKEIQGIIVSEPSNPWVSGVERLYTKEFYQLAFSKLSEQGIFTQWFHAYFMSKDTLKLVLRTFNSVFPEVRVFVNGNDLIILGSSSALSLTQLEMMYAQSEIKEDLAKISINSIDDLLSRELRIFPREFAGDGVIHTLEYPQLAYHAAKDFFANHGVLFDRVIMEVFDRAMRTAATRKSLTAEYLKTTNNLATFARALAQTWCPEGTTEFYSGWEQARTQCREALVLLALYQQNTPAFGPNEKQIQLLRYITGVDKKIVTTIESQAKVEKTKSVSKNNKATSQELPLAGLTDKEVYEALQLYTNLASPLMPSSSEILHLAMKRCEATTEDFRAQCLFKGIEAFTITLDGDSAGQYLNWATRTQAIPEKALNTLNHLVQSAKRAALLTQ